MTMIETRPPDLGVAPSPEAAPTEQSRLHRVLFGTNKRRPRRHSGQAPEIVGLWRLRAIAAVLWLGLAVGVVGGLAALSGLTSSPAAPVVDAVPDIAVPRDVGVGGFGELYVAAWLSAGEDSAGVLAPYYPTPVDLGAVTSGGLWAARTASVDIVEAGENYWAVTIAAEVLSLAKAGTYEPAGIRFYTFGVVHTEAGFAATSLPAQVPAPATLESPELVIDALSRPAGDLEPIAEALDGFFDALLANAGDLERYVSPDASIAPVSPPPFTDTDIRSLGARAENAIPALHLVRVEVVGLTSTGDSAQVLHYTATLTQRAGRWEVLELVAASPIP